MKGSFSYKAMSARILNFIKREIKPCNSIFAVLMYTVFSFIYTFPLILHFNKYVIGDLEGDMWKHLWGFWWVHKRIFEDGVLPLFTSILNYPYGGSLFFIDPLGAVLSLPFQTFLPVHVAFNLLVILNLVFGAFCAYLLADYFIKNKAAAFYSGAVFAFTAYLLAYITSGVSETYNIGWIPLFLYFYARTLKENNEIFPIMAGICMFMVTFGCFYYGSFATIFGIFMFIYFAYAQFRKIVISGKGKKLPDIPFLRKLRAFTDSGGTQRAPVFATDQVVSDIPRKKSRNIVSGSFYTGRSRVGKKVLGFREWLLRLMSYLAVVVMVIDIILAFFFLPLYLASPGGAGLGFWTFSVLLLIIFMVSAIFFAWYNRSAIRNLVFKVQGYFFSENPKYIKYRMYMIFGIYAFTILGFMHLWSVIRQDTLDVIFRICSLTVGVFIVAIIMTYLEIRGDVRFSKRKAGQKKKSVDEEKKKTRAILFKEYARIFVPWMVLGLAILNILRIMIFYKNVEEVFGLGNIIAGIIVSTFLIAGSAGYIIHTKIYLKWRLFRKLYIEPEIPAGIETPEIIADITRKTIRRNIVITGILILSVAIPPLILYFRGFSPQEYVRYWVLFALTIAVLGSIIYFLSGKRDLSGKKGEDESPGLIRYFRVMLRGPIRRLVIMSIIALALIGPLFYTFKASLEVSQGLVKRERSLEFIDLYLSKRFHNISRLIDYGLPGKQNIVRTYTVDRLTRSSYAGWITIILAIAAVIWARRRKYFWFWAFCAGFFIVFSLGPFLYVTDKIHANFRFPLYILFYKYFPFFNQISIPYRFNICAMLSLSILAGYALARFFRTWKLKSQNLLVTILGLAMLFEICVISPAPYPIPLSDLEVPTFYQRIADDHQDYGIIDSPIQRVKGELLPGEYFYYQMIHGKGIPYKVEGTIPVYIYENQFTIYLFNLEKGYSVSPPKEELLQQYKKDLQKNRIKYIVVHNQYLKKSSRERVHTYLKYFLGQPEKMDRDLYIYKIY